MVFDPKANQRNNKSYHTVKVKESINALEADEEEEELPFMKTNNTTYYNSQKKF